MKQCAAQLMKNIEAPDTLINNAGTALWSYQETCLGIEADFAINHLGHFQLTEVGCACHASHGVPLLIIDKRMDALP